jgi:UDP-N-acetylglucosamine 4,6-dehydratase
MVPKDDARNTVEFRDYYVIKPAFHFFERRFVENNCNPVAEDFEYNSKTNTWWLTVDEMQMMVSDL